MNSFAATPRIQTWGQAVDQADSGLLRQGPQHFINSLSAKGTGVVDGLGIRGRPHGHSLDNCTQMVHDLQHQGLNHLQIVQHLSASGHLAECHDALVAAGVINEQNQVLPD